MSNNPQIESLAYDPGKLVLASAAPARRFLQLPKNVLHGQLGALSAAEAFNSLSEIPADGNFGVLLRVKGCNNLAIRGYLSRNSATLTAGTENSVVRVWGVAADASFPSGLVTPSEPISLLSGQYFGEATFTTGAALIALPTGSPLIPPQSTSNSWCDVVSITAGNPHTGFNNSLGAAGSGRWLRIVDLMGYPAVYVQWRNSAAAVAFNGEYYQY